MMKGRFKMKLILITLTAACLFSQTAFAVTPSALWEAFQEEFPETHIGDRVTISAVVADTHVSIYMTPVVSLVDEIGDEVRVICVLPRSDMGKLSSFKKGEKVRMSGNLYAAREDKIVIKQCQVDNQ